MSGRLTCWHTLTVMLMTEPVSDAELFGMVEASAGRRAHLLAAEDATGIVLSRLYGDTVSRRNTTLRADQVKAKGARYAARSVRNLAATSVWEAEVAEAAALGSDYWCPGRELPERYSKFTREASKCVCGLVRFLSGAEYVPHPDRLGVVRMGWCGSPEVRREFNRLSELERAQLARVYEDRIVADSGTTERADFDHAFNHLRGNLNLRSVGVMTRSYDQLREDGGDIVVTEVDVLDLADPVTGEVDRDGMVRYQVIEGAGGSEG